MSVSPDRILYSDDHLLAVNKLSGELVVKGTGPVQKLPLFDFLKKDYPGLRSVHRLDFETSGVVVFARTKAAYDSIMNTKFDRWKKMYRTLVEGVLPAKQGVIKKKLPARSQGLVDAVTHYSVLQNFGGVSYVEAEIETGRHHQIRRHFAMIKHPLVLDQEYGDRKFNTLFTREFRLARFFLHAFSVDLPHPVTGKPLHIEAPLPKTFVALLVALGREN